MNTLFDQAGGAPFFERLVERFYAGIESDEMLRPMYPADLRESKRHMALFLMQYFGGPGTYSQERGHPRLRMRHGPFSIGQGERDAWVRHMRAAVEGEEMPPEVRAGLLEYFERAATFMMNR
jgi:hemoglobin